MMHGHTHGVKAGTERACAYAAQIGADVLLYGHTHIQAQTWYQAGTSFGNQVLQKPLLVCNPGSLFDGNFGTLSIRNQGVLFGFGCL
jgi:predicted phosphodiesterase